MENGYNGNKGNNLKGKWNDDLMVIMEIMDHGNLMINGNDNENIYMEIMDIMEMEKREKWFDG